jgi:hypothetical protein
MSVPTVWTKQAIKELKARAKKCDSIDQVHAYYPDKSYSSIQTQLRRIGVTFDRGAKPLTNPVAVQERVAAIGQQETIAALTKEQKHLLKIIADKEAQIVTLGALASVPVSPIKIPGMAGKDPKRRVATPVMLCSDWHIEEPVRREAVMGLSEYNLDIADKRIHRCFEAFEWFTHDSRFDMQRSAVIWLGGDLFSGYIHEELVENNQLSPTESVAWLFVRLVREIKWLLANTQIERFVFPCNDGNHGRTTHKIRVSTRTKNSYEWLLYKMLAEAFKSEARVQFQIAEGEWTDIDIYNQTFGFTHGDHFQYQGGVGGLLIPVQRGMNHIVQYKKIDHAAMGHFHQRLDLGHLSVNGSMIGITPYSLHVHAKPERPQQSWFLVDSKEGKCVSAPVWL